MDAMKMEILPDGTIKTTTDAVSAANHTTADMLVRAVERAAGGSVLVEARRDLRGVLIQHASDGHTHTQSEGGDHGHE